MRRKKAFEHQLEQTSAQMMTVEREISSIETANINKETLDAMKGAQQAMKKIHGDLSIEKVDQTMEDLREQHAIGEEIADALTQGNQMQGVDEDELEDELAELQQEELDNKMLKTGNVPVSDQLSRLPNRPVGESESRHFHICVQSEALLLTFPLCSQEQCTDRIRRGRRAAKAASRNGNVRKPRIWAFFFWRKLQCIYDLCCRMPPIRLELSPL